MVLRSEGTLIVRQALPYWESRFPRQPGPLDGAVVRGDLLAEVVVGVIGAAVAAERATVIRVYA
jgi:hypothetical protein